MNKKTFALLTGFFIVTISFAKTITVSNNPTGPGQYQRLDSAILAASPGDILLFSGSVTNYARAAGTITIDKPQVLYGQGYDPRNDEALASTISTIHITTGGSGTTFSGFNISNEIHGDFPTNNIKISKCNIVVC